MLEGKGLTQFICCLIRKKNFWKVKRIVHVSLNFKIGMLILGRWKHLSALRRTVKTFLATNLVLITANKRTGVAADCTLSQPIIPGTGWRAQHPTQCVRCCWPRGWLSTAVVGKKMISFWLDLMLCTPGLLHVLILLYCLCLACTEQALARIRQKWMPAHDNLSGSSGLGLFSLIQYFIY